MASNVFELIAIPREAVRFPLAVPIPEGFDLADPTTWPRVPGRLEYFGRRLWYMPPCGDLQQATTVDVVTELNLWVRAHAGFVLGGNEAGMLLGDEVRAADAAVWRAEELGAYTGGYRRVPPLLAVEVTGQDEELDDLDAKAAWYLDHGVRIVWIVDPRARLVRVITSAGRFDVPRDGVIPPDPALPELSPRVSEFFRQLT